MNTPNIAKAKTKSGRDIHDDMDLSQVTDLATLEKYAAHLRKRSDEDEFSERVSAAMKTVSTFSHLIGRKMTLVNESVAYTDGTKIAAPFSHAYFYEFVEHEISHNLFKSNIAAKVSFTEQYVLQVAKAMGAFGKHLLDKDRDTLSSMVGTILNVIEDHRVNSLWAMLYPGSYRRLCDYSRATMKKGVPTAHNDIITYFLCVAYAVPVPPGRFDRFEPAMVAALKKVERKGPGATFVVGKWLMTQIVSEMIRISKKLPPPPKAGTSKVKTDLDQMQRPMLSGGTDDADDADDADDSKADSGSDAGDDGPDSPDTGAGDSGDVDGDEDGDKGGMQGGGGADGADGDDGTGSGTGEWQPPPVTATPEERVDAFSDLLKEAALSMDPSSGSGAQPGAKKALERVNNGQSPSLDPHAASNAKAIANNAFNTDVTNDTLLQEYLAKSEENMLDVVEQIQDALERENTMSEKDWMSRGIAGKVVFHDIERARWNPTPMQPEDAKTSKRLREFFHRVKSKTTKRLADEGCEIDIPAAVAWKSSGHPGPVFKTDVSGRGFKTLVLIDRSSSMDGDRSISVERASRMLRGALKLPNVEYHVWGFCGMGGTVDIFRVKPGLDICDSVEMRAVGNTPMATAIRAAVNWFATGSEKKQLILLTDGEPNSDDKLDGSKDARVSVQRELRRATKMGINVSTLVIGGAINTDSAKMMFGHPRQWKQVKGGKDLTKALVDLVSGSFSDFLKEG
jgi:hypothetical protein